MRTAREWKEYYAAERAALGERGLAELVDAAPDVALPRGGALIFPHTRLAESGTLVAAAARAVVRSGCEHVLALGVLHGAREVDRDEVARARAGDADAIATLRRVHGEDLPGDDGRWTEEFSLDNFRALLAVAARGNGGRPPRVVACYPFLTGASPHTLRGFDLLLILHEWGAPVVATADMVHHGHGYGTAPDRCVPDGAEGLAYATRAIGRQLDQLRSRDYAAFQKSAVEDRSDFRDAGPVLTEILRPSRATVHDVRLVDYAQTLDAPRPTWVAAALVAVHAA